MMVTTVSADRILLPTGWAANACLRIDDGRIAAIDSGLSWAGPAAGQRHVNVIAPAMANAHAHGFHRALDIPAGLNVSDWRGSMHHLARRLTPDQIRAIAALAYVEMLEAGYGSVAEFHYLHHAPDGTPYDNLAETSVAIASAASDAGIGLTHLPALYTQGGSDGRAPRFEQRRFVCDLDMFAALVEQADTAIAATAPDARIGVAAHSLSAVGVEALTMAQTLRPDAPFHLHIAGQRAEAVEVLATHGATPVKWLLEIMDVDARWCLVHAAHVTWAEAAGLARSGAVAGWCPSTETMRGKGDLDRMAYLRAGGRMGIGSDTCRAISLAGDLRSLAGDGGSLTEAIYRAALAGGAQALGRRAGAIAIGNWADLVGLRAGPGVEDNADSVEFLDLWTQGKAEVTDVWSAGRHVVRGGRHIARDGIEATFHNVVQDLRSAL